MTTEQMYFILSYALGGLVYLNISLRYDDSRSLGAKAAILTMWPMLLGGMVLIAPGMWVTSRAETGGGLWGNTSFQWFMVASCVVFIAIGLAMSGLAIGFLDQRIF